MQPSLERIQQVFYIKGAERKEFSVNHRLYSAAELTALLLAGGFSAVETYGDIEGAPFDQNAKRLVAVATK